MAGPICGGKTKVKDMLPRRLHLVLGSLLVSLTLIVCLCIPMWFGSYLPNNTSQSSAVWARGYSGYDNENEYYSYAFLDYEFLDPQNPPPDSVVDVFFLYVTYIPAAKQELLTQATLNFQLRAYGRFNAMSKLDLSSFGEDKTLTLLVDGTSKELKNGVRLPWVHSQTVTIFPISTQTGPNFYPFDAYSSEIITELMVEGKSVPWGMLVNTEPSPLDVSMVVEYPAIWVDENDEAFPDEYQDTSLIIGLAVDRAILTQVYSMFAVVMMWILSTFIFCMALDTLFFRPRDPALPPIAASFALLFALPNIRNAQPGVPQIGIAIDVWGFMWNILLVALSACAFMIAHFAYSPAKRWSPIP